MPPEITLTVTYHDLPFLSKLAVSCDSPSIVPAHARVAAALIKRLNGKNFTPITYERKLYKISNGGAMATLGCCWPRNSNFVCNQSMLCKLRRVLSAEQSVEIDMENAQSQLL